MRRGRYKGHCRMTRSRSPPGGQTRKIKRLHDADPCLLSPASALERITDSSRTSRQVRNGPMWGRLRVGKENLHFATLVGAAMCSASHDDSPVNGFLPTTIRGELSCC